MIGRTEEIHHLIRALEPSGARIQVVGPPGIGKSTIARAASADSTSVWVSLEPITDAGFVEALAQSLDVPANDEAIAGALADLDVLGLDGAEGVVPAVEAALARWEKEAPGIRVVVTTQRRLVGVPALELGPLCAEDAEALFRLRAASVTSDLELASEQEAIAALVAQLDGWPLAIELAASRLRLFRPSELLDESPLQVLEDSRRQPRHSSLRAALEQSWSLLTASERTALSRVAGFREGFDRKAFETVTSEPLSTLERLLDSSMVRWKPTPTGRRYTLLEPVRLFARARIEPGEVEEAERVVAECVLARAEQAVAIERSSRAAEANQILRRWFADLLALLDRGDELSARAAIALCVLAKASGPTRQAIEWVQAVPREGLSERIRRELDLRQAALHVRADAPPADLSLVDWPDDPAVLTLRALILMGQNHLARALETAERARELSVSLGLANWVVEATFAIGVIRLQAGDAHPAADRFNEGLEQLRSMDRPNLEGLVLKFSALADRQLGRPLRGQINKLERAVALHRSTHAQRLEAMAVAILAVAQMDVEDPEAEATLARAQLLSRRAGETTSRRHMFVLAGFSALDHGDPSALRTMLLERFPESNLWIIATRRMLEGLLAHFSGLADEAIRLLESARDDLYSMGIENDAIFAACLRAVLDRSPPPPRPGLPAESPVGLAWQIADHLHAGDPLPAQLSESARRFMEIRVLLQVANQSSGTEVSSSGTWFRGPDGKHVDLSRKRVLRRVLASIAGHDGPITQVELLEKAWPGERMAADSGRARVHVAISELRKMGLRDVLVTVDRDGSAAYRLRARIVAE